MALRLIMRVLSLLFSACSRYIIKDSNMWITNLQLGCCWHRSARYHSLSAAAISAWCWLPNPRAGKSAFCPFFAGRGTFSWKIAHSSWQGLPRLPLRTTASVLLRHGPQYSWYGTGMCATCKGNPLELLG